jgi:flavin reductase (DIM6/NTAB) family NADH-FMN oxidoreductase RutF/predicted ester cyclase
MEDTRAARLSECWESVWNCGEVDVLDDLVSAHYVRHARSGELIGIEDVKASIGAARRAFPDMVTNIEEIIESGDKVVVRWSSTGTHVGELAHFSGTGQRMRVEGVNIQRFDGDRIAEEWVSWSPAEYLPALGLNRLDTGRPANTECDRDGASLDDGLVRQVHRKFLTGVTVVTVSEDREPFGLAVNAFTSISLTPPMILVCVARSSSTHPILFRSRYFAVSILAADQTELAAKFGRRGAEKFASVDWRFGKCGSPILAGCCGHFEAEVSERIEASTHTIFVGRLVDADCDNAAPLLYMDGNFYDPSRLVDSAVHG